MCMNASMTHASQLINTACMYVLTEYSIIMLEILRGHVNRVDLYHCYTQTCNETTIIVLIVVVLTVFIMK